MSNASDLSELIALHDQLIAHPHLNGDELMASAVEDFLIKSRPAVFIEAAYSLSRKPHDRPADTSKEVPARAGSKVKAKPSGVGR